MKPLRLGVLATIALTFLLAASPELGAAETGYPPSVSLSEVQSAIAKARREHPRLLATRADMAVLKAGGAPGSLRQVLGTAVLHEAESLMDRPPVTRTLEGRRLLGQSRTCLSRVLVLASAYHLTGRDEFVRRCEQELLAAAGFTDWNPSHFLDVAEMSLALALGYDWLYDALDDGARRRIREALVEKALRLPFESGHNGWVRSSNNWGQVCHAGLTAAALALLEDEPDLAARTIQSAVNNVHHSMAAYAPNGSYPEGPGYWSYGTSFNVILIGVLEGVLGTDFGLSKAPGFSLTGQYPALVTGPSGKTFNYADGGSGRGPEPVLQWFARRYGRPDWLRGEDARIRNQPAGGGRLTPLALLWMEDAPAESPSRPPLHWFGGGSVPISLHRSSWEDPNAVFLGVKGGSPSANHGNMDIGSFVLDAQGVRWALDLGAEGYYRIESRGMNLWDRRQDSDRWTVFRQMNHSHNTLVIDDQLQRAAGFGRFEHFSDNPAFPHSVLDLTEVYAGQADSVRRGLALLPNGHVLIRDELAGLRPGARVRWGMITPATPDSNSGRIVQLRQGGKALELNIESPRTDVAWTTIDTARPRREWDSPNPGTVMVAFEAVAPADGRLTLAVVARPGGTGGKTGESAGLERIARPLSEWR